MPRHGCPGRFEREVLIHVDGFERCGGGVSEPSRYPLTTLSQNDDTTLRRRLRETVDRSGECSPLSPTCRREGFLAQCDGTRGLRKAAEVRLRTHRRRPQSC